MKKIISILLILFLNGCGYTAVYKNQEKPDFKILIEKISGDTSINKIVEKKLKRYSSVENDLIYLININSDFYRTVLTKNKTGRATNVNLKTNIQFNVKLNNKIENYSYQESINIENSSDIYEQNKYENSIKNIFVSTIIEKLIIELNTLK